MLVLAHTRRVHFVVEQPLNSLLYHVQHVRDSFSITAATRMVTHLGAFGSPTVKPLELWTTISTTDIIQLSMSRRQAQVALGGAKLYAVVQSTIKKPSSQPRAKGWCKDKWVSKNGDAMKATQEYPSRFAELVADIAAAHLSSSAAAAAALPCWL
eukprot:2596631-Pyramimonas_sp.AAC.1